MAYSQEQKARWIAMYHAGESTKVIAAQEGVASRTVYLHLKAARVDLRPAGRPKVYPGATKADHARRAGLKKYGIDTTEYQRLLEQQNGVCAICRNPPDGIGKTGKVLHVDHDHKTGAVRGLLCRTCNPALGAFADDIARLKQAIVYLESHA